MATSHARCATCVAWEQEGCIDGWGECRSNPPHVDLSDGEGMWPATRAHGWCRKHEARTQEAREDDE